MSRSPAPFSLRLVRRWTFALAALVLGPGALAGQVADRDARIPQPGSLWIQFAPEFVSWNEQFAANSAVLEDGQREPLYAHYDGSIAARLFPGLDPMLAVVNRDAGALGFTPLAPGQLELGSLEFGSIEVFARRIPLDVQLGIGGFASIEVAAPLVQTEVETGFTFDSASAVLVRGESVLADPATFFSQLDAAQGQLEALLAGGTLGPADSAAVIQLLSDSQAFESALSTRVTTGEYLFTAGSVAGQQITSHYGGFETGFQAYGVTLPSLTLPETAVRADMNSYFQNDPVLGQPLQNVSRGWAIPEIQIGARFKLLDTFGWPQRPASPPPEPVELPPVTVAAPPTADSALAAPDSAAVSAADSAAVSAPDSSAVSGADSTAALDSPAAPDSLAKPVAGAPDSLAAPVAPPAPDSLATRATATAPDSLAAEYPAESPGLRFRTTLGARYSIPLGNPDQDPYMDPDVFLQQPVGTGAADLEIELYQDIGLGRSFLAVIGATYGIQMADDLVRRVAPPGRPYAYATQKTEVSRDPGDFLRIVVSPRFSLTEALSLAVEYTFWDKKRDTYTSSGSVDAAPLEWETGQTRHMLGVGAYYRTIRMFAAGRASLPVDLAFLWQTSISGVGGQTPAWGVVTASLRVPIQLF